MTDDTDKIDDLLLDIAWKDYTLCFDDRRELENKTGMVLAANGILSGFVISANVFLYPGSVHLCLFMFIMSSAFCICAMDLQKYQYLRPMKMRNALKKSNLLSDFEQSKKNIYATIASAANSNRNAYGKIAFWTRCALISFLIGLIVLLLALGYNVVIK